MLQSVTKVQKKGQITIPSNLREEWGISEGDFVAFESVDEGILLTPQRVVSTQKMKAAMQALDAIAEELESKGVTLDELVADGREIRGDLLKELYGIDND